MLGHLKMAYVFVLNEQTIQQSFQTVVNIGPRGMKGVVVLLFLFFAPRLGAWDVKSNLRSLWGELELYSQCFGSNVNFVLVVSFQSF